LFDVILFTHQVRTLPFSNERKLAGIVMSYPYPIDEEEDEPDLYAREIIEDVIQKNKVRSGTERKIKGLFGGDCRVVVLCLCSWQVVLFMKGNK